MNPTCAECGGKCCKTLLMQNAVLTSYQREFVETRGKAVGEHALLDCRCKHLTDDGRCGIYEQRPQAGRDYEVGGEFCSWTRLHA